MNNSISFYLQFVHYSNNELMNMKQFIYESFPELHCHLISNKSFSKLFNLQNTIGKFLYLTSNNSTIDNIIKILNDIPKVNNKFTQLNLVFIRINSLFISPFILKLFLNKIQDLKSTSIYKYIFNFTLNTNYSLFWTRINNFHTKYFFISKKLYDNNIKYRKLFLFNYI